MCLLLVCSFGLSSVSVGSLRSLSVRLREGEVIGWNVKQVSVSSRSRAEGSSSGLVALRVFLSGVSAVYERSYGLVSVVQVIYTGIVYSAEVTTWV